MARGETHKNESTKERVGGGEGEGGRAECNEG